uniref:Beta-defensin n=1 Tax=Suricata suricatta TaxID=37032 RepID=A0A673STF6_SURSU
MCPENRVGSSSRRFRGLPGFGTMRLFSLLIFVVLFIAQVIPGYRHGDMPHFCDSHTSVCLRRKRNCVIRLPGLCPGRSFCCIRMK